MTERPLSTYSKEWEPTGEKIFITGYSGLVGYGIVSVALGKDNILGFSRGVTKDIFKGDSRLKVVEGDLLSRDQLYSRVKEGNPSLVLHLAAATDVDKCQKEREWAWRMNVVATENLADVCEKFGIPMVAFSTDFVFPRTGGPFSVDDKPSLLTDTTGQIVNVYGETKLEAEKRVLKLPKGQRLIVRVVAPYDHRYESKPGIPPILLKVAREGKPIKAVYDGKNTYTFGGDLASVVNQIILEKTWKDKDVVHIAGPEPLSAFDILQIIGKYFPLPEMIKVKQDEYFAGRAPRPIDGGLISSYPTRSFESVLTSEMLYHSAFHVGGGIYLTPWDQGSILNKLCP